MPTLQERIDTAVTNIEIDQNKLKDIVNGPATGANSAVMTDGGPVNTLARSIAGFVLAGTSLTSLAIGIGSKVFTVQSGAALTVGQWLLISSDADPANYMHGQITAYSGTSLSVNITNFGGTGTLSDWSIRLSGTQGAKGDIGNQGDAWVPLWQGPWATATAYAPDDSVLESGSSYICLTAHVSDIFPTDLAASKWVLMAQKGVDG
ncbi:MAG TPA: hypothetical protein ENI69_10360, partial [Rhodospirillales bacterium]|nr:hypothetical protein [Rhodospirillales bacterium]